MNTSQAGQGQLKVELTQPATSLQPCRCRVQEVSPQDYRIQYTPNDPGRYQLRLLFNNQLVQGKTFDTDVHVAPASKASTPLSLVHIQQLRPIETPEIGDDVCLQSQPLRLDQIRACNDASPFQLAPSILPWSPFKGRSRAVECPFLVKSNETRTRQRGI